MEITCKTCGYTGDCSKFSKNKQITRGYNLCCRNCTNEKQRNHRVNNGNSDAKKYEKTLPGLIMRTYRNMLSRVTGVQKKKSHLYEGLPILTNGDFKEWATNREDLKQLYVKWVESGNIRKLTPSIDRINSDEGYLIGNMRWLTHSENSSLGAKSKRRVKSETN